MRKARAIAMALLTGLASHGAISADAMGYVKTSSGDAFIVSAGKSAKAASGDPVFVGDLLRTGANGSLGMTLKDNTLMSFGPSTEFTVETYVFVPTKGELGLSGRILRGSLQYVSGVIAKLRPESVSIVTPTATVGIRGTRFVLKVEE